MATARSFAKQRRTIYYAGAPTNVTLDEKKSRLGADGKTRPVIAVRFTDKDGRAVRQGLSGEFQINEPYQAYDVRCRRSSAIRSPDASVASRASKLAKTAPRLIELMPTTKTGEVVLTFSSMTASGRRFACG